MTHHTTGTECAGLRPGVFVLGALFAGALLAVAAFAGAPAPFAAARRLPLRESGSGADTLVVRATTGGDGGGRLGATWSAWVEQGVNPATGGPALLGSGGAAGDDWANGAAARSMPEALLRLVGDRRLHGRGHFDPLNKDFSRDTVQLVGREFSDTWSPVRGSVGADAGLGQLAGDTWRFGRFALEFDERSRWTRTHSLENTRERLFAASGASVYDYDEERGGASTRMGAAAVARLRVGSGQGVSAHASVDRDADDEGRTYSGFDGAARVSVSGDRLLYVQREVREFGGSGRHVVGPGALALEWAVSRTQGDRLQPDRREVLYLAPSVALFDSARREFAEQHQRGRAGSAGAALLLGRGGHRGSLRVRWEHESLHRDRSLRRFDFQPAYSSSPLAPPESLFVAGRWTGYGGALINESTLGGDNGSENRNRDAMTVALDVAANAALRITAGIRDERSVLETRSFLPWSRNAFTGRGRLDERGWLPSLGMTWNTRPTTTVKLLAGRTMNRPTFDEYSAASYVDLRDGVRVQGNPALRSGRADRISAAWEAGGPARKFSVAVFRERLLAPIEPQLSGRPGSWTLSPVNSGDGAATGAAFSARSDLGAVVRALTPLSWTATLDMRSSRTASRLHGGASHSRAGDEPGFATGLRWSRSPDGGGIEVVMRRSGERLVALGDAVRPDLRADPVTFVDANAALRVKRAVRILFSGTNVTNATVRVRQGALETWRSRPGAAWTASVALGS